MKKIKLCFIFFAIIFIVSGCSKCPHKSFLSSGKTASVAHPISKTYSHLRFDRLALGGNIDAAITRGKSPSITLQGDARILNQNFYRYGARTVYIILPPCQGYAIKAKIVVPALMGLALAGGTNVKADNLCVGNLSLEAKNGSNVSLKGSIFARQTLIYQHGKGKVNISWLDSDIVKISSDNSGIILLAGTSHELVARLSDSAYFDGKYLRSNIVDIHARENASAFVTPLAALHAYAEDHSNIFYYNEPDDLRISTKDSGNVLFAAGILH